MWQPKRVWSNKKIVRQGKKQVWLIWEELMTYEGSWKAIDPDLPLEVYKKGRIDLQGTDKLQVYDNSIEEIGTVDDYIKGWGGDVESVALLGIEGTPMYAWRWLGATIQVNPYTAKNVKVDITSSDSTIVSIGEIMYDEHPTEWSVGYVTINPVAVGTATITITSQANPSATQTYNVEVLQDVPVTSISKNGQYLTDVCATNWMGLKIGEIKYTPTNAVAVGMDVGIRPKEWETNIGRGWVMPSASQTWVADVMFNVDSSVAQVWDTSTYEIFLNNDPTFTPLEFTVTVRKACTVTVLTKNLQTGESGWGTVDPTLLIVPKGSEAKSDSDSREKLFFTPYLKTVATAYPSTPYAHFDFHSWDLSALERDPITGEYTVVDDCTITADFEETEIPAANITFSPEEASQYVTISPSTMEVPDGSQVDYVGYDKIIINGNPAEVSVTSSGYSYPSYGRVAFTSYIPKGWWSLNWRELYAWDSISSWNQNIILGWWDNPITLISSDGVDIQSDLDNNRPAFVLSTTTQWFINIDGGCYVDIPPVFENVEVHISDGEISTDVDPATGILIIFVTTPPSDPTITWTIEFDLVMPHEGSEACYGDGLLVKHVVATLKYAQI